MRRFRITALLALILPTILLASSMSAQKASTDEFGTATLYPWPAGESPSPRYEIRIIDRSGVSRQTVSFTRLFEGHKLSILLRAQVVE